MGMTRAALSTRNHKYPIFFQYLKKEVSDEVDFLHAYKHQSFPQVHTVLSGGLINLYHRNNLFHMSIKDSYK